jgi:hypothetical protein
MACPEQALMQTCSVQAAQTVWSLKRTWSA